MKRSIGITVTTSSDYRGLDPYMGVTDYTEFHLIQWMRNSDAHKVNYGTMCYIYLQKSKFVALSSALTTRAILDKLMHTSRAGRRCRK